MAPDRTGLLHRRHDAHFGAAGCAGLAVDIEYAFETLRPGHRRAARLAGRNRTDFYKLMNRYGVDPAEFKSRNREEVAES